MLTLSCRLILLRLMLASVLLSALPAVAVQNVQGVLAGQDQQLDAALEQRGIALVRSVVSASRDDPAPDDPLSDSAALSALPVLARAVVTVPLVAVGAFIPLSANRLLPPAQAPPAV